MALGSFLSSIEPSRQAMHNSREILRRYTVIGSGFSDNPMQKGCNGE